MQLTATTQQQQLETNSTTVADILLGWTTNKLTATKYGIAKVL